MPGTAGRAILHIALRRRAETALCIIITTDVIHALRYCRMIGSFKAADTEALAKGERVPRFVNSATVTRRKLRQLEIAGRLEDPTVPPGNRLEALKGDRVGQYSIRKPMENSTIRRELQLSGTIVDRFAELTGDRSTLHTDDAFARRSRFRERPAYGMHAVISLAALAVLKPEFIALYSCLLTLLVSNGLMARSSSFCAFTFRLGGPKTSCSG